MPQAKVAQLSGSKRSLGLLTAMIFALSGAVSCRIELKSQPLRVGINAWPGYEFIALAEILGYYDSMGVSVKIIEYNSLSDARRAFERGQIDGIGATVIELLHARDHSDRELKAVQVIDYSNGADVVVARPNLDSSHKKRIAFEAGSLGVYLLSRYLKYQGLEAEDIDLMPLDQGSMIVELCSGSVDLAVTYPPASVEMQEKCGAETVFHSGQIPGEIVDVIAFGEATIRDRPKDIRRFLDAFYAAQAHWAKNRNWSDSVMAKREGISRAAFAEAIDQGMRLVSRQNQAEYLRSGGTLHDVVQLADSLLRVDGHLTRVAKVQGAISQAFLQP